MSMNDVKIDHWVTINGKHVPIDKNGKILSRFGEYKSHESTTSQSVNPVLKGGQKDPEITDSIQDYFLPQSVRDKFSIIEKIESYNDLKKYLESKGIQLTTDLKILTTEKADEHIEAVKNLSQKIAVAIETYTDLYGKNALSSLKRVHLYDQNIGEQASYHFNRIGEKDPWAGTIRFKDWSADGRIVFHELAHAFQDSNKGKGEDAISYSTRISKSVSMPRGSYKGMGGDTTDAEQMADALAFGFTRRGMERNRKFIQDLYRQR